MNEAEAHVFPCSQCVCRAGRWQGMRRSCGRGFRARTRVPARALPASNQSRTDWRIPPNARTSRCSCSVTVGECVYLFERTARWALRPQKFIEEAPAPGMTAERRLQWAMRHSRPRVRSSTGRATAVHRGGRRFSSEMNTACRSTSVTEMSTDRPGVVRLVRGFACARAGDFPYAVTSMKHASMLKIGRAIFCLNRQARATDVAVS